MFGVMYLPKLAVSSQPMAEAGLVHQQQEETNLEWLKLVSVSFTKMPVWAALACTSAGFFKGLD